MAVLCGHVYCIYVPLATKEKLVVPAYVQTDSLVRFFFINSERTNFQINNPNISNHILSLSQTANARFLTYDSWLCCNEVIGGLTVEEFEANPDSYRCALDDLTINRVRALIEQSSLYSKIQINNILQQWPVV